MSKTTKLKLAPGFWREPDREPAKELVIQKQRTRRATIPKFLTVKEVAEILRRKVDFVYELIKDKKIDVQPVGGRYLITEADLAEYLEREKAQAG